jgi:hypothetical protein
MKRITAIAAAVVLFSAIPAGSYLTTPKAHASGLSNPAGAFTTSGSTILKGGTPFVNYGVTLSNLQFPSEVYVGSGYSAANSPALATMKSELDAIAGAWHGNTVRIQVQQDQYVDSVNGDPTQPSSYSSEPTYYENLTKDAISYAEGLGLVVVINAQTEANNTGPNAGIPFDFGGTSNTTAEDMPTANTETFWSDMYQAYGSDPNIVIDSFNEPRLPSMTLDQWLNGTTGFIGFQDLTDYIRALGWAAQIWQEAPIASLITTPADLIADPDSNSVYSYHHVSNGNDPYGDGYWATQFGDLITQDNVPVVDGEWTNRTEVGPEFNGAYPNGNAGQCWGAAPTEVPTYLSYLASLNIGMTMWTLGPDENDLSYDVMNRTSSYSTPNSYSGWTSGCDQSQGAVRAGAGQDIMNLFDAQDSFNP